MLADTLVGKSISTALDSKTQKAAIIAAVEIGSTKELNDKLNVLKRSLSRTSGGAVLLIAVKI